MHIALEYIPHGDLGKYIIDYSVKARTEALEIATFSPVRVKIIDFGVSGSWAGMNALNTNCGTVAYKAPELLGLLPSHIMIPEQLYNWSVDIWALGAVIHQVLTSQILFLMLEEGADNSRFSTSSEWPVTPQWSTDFALLQEYCANPLLFPLAGLTLHGASPDAIDFVKSLMVPDPKKRVSAAVAFRSVWLVNVVSSLGTTGSTLPKRVPPHLHRDEFPPHLHRDGFLPHLPRDGFRPRYPEGLDQPWEEECDHPPPADVAQIL